MSRPVRASSTAEPGSKKRTIAPGDPAREVVDGEGRSRADLLERFERGVGRHRVECFQTVAEQRRHKMAACHMLFAVQRDQRTVAPCTAESRDAAARRRRGGRRSRGPAQDLP